MKYLVTGGCGFVGSNMAAEVLSRGEELCVFDNLSREGSSANLAWLQEQGEFEFAHGDVRNRHDVDRLIDSARPDVIFHLAGQVAMTTSVTQPFKDFETNTLGTIALLEAIRAHCPEAIVMYSSTNKVYGDLDHLRYEETATRYVCPNYPNGLPEALPLDLSTPYGCSKGSADQYVRDYNRMFGLRTAVFRHSSMYGGRQYPTFDQGWVGWFIRQALETKKHPGHTFSVSGTGKQVRDLLNSADVVQLYFSAAEHIDSVQGKIFNVGGGPQNALSIIELLHLLSEKLDVEISPQHVEARSRDQKVFVADNSSIERAIGWKPSVSAEAGIASQIDWLQML